MAETEKRKEKLHQLFRSLTPIAAFSREQAKERCPDLTPQFVTTTLNEMVREGVLDRYSTSEQETYAWRNTRVRMDPAHWIERQINGTQVTAQPEEDRPRERYSRTEPNRFPRQTCSRF